MIFVCVLINTLFVNLINSHITKIVIDYNSYSLLQLIHLTFTPLESIRSNFFEPQFVQIGHARDDFTNNDSLIYI